VKEARYKDYCIFHLHEMFRIIQQRHNSDWWLPKNGVREERKRGEIVEWIYVLILE
jgi:hypothetical protein